MAPRCHTLPSSETAGKLYTASWLTGKAGVYDYLHVFVSAQDIASMCVTVLFANIMKYYIKMICLHDYADE